MAKYSKRNIAIRSHWCPSPTSRQKNEVIGESDVRKKQFTILNRWISPLPSANIKIFCQFFSNWDSCLFGSRILYEESSHPHLFWREYSYDFFFLSSISLLLRGSIAKKFTSLFFGWKKSLKWQKINWLGRFKIRFSKKRFKVSISIPPKKRFQVRFAQNILATGGQVIEGKLYFCFDAKSQKENACGNASGRRAKYRNCIQGNFFLSRTES